MFFLGVQTQAANLNYGAEANPTGNPIGGGAGYSRILLPSQAGFVVADKTQLLSALASVASGQIVYIADSAEIDLTGESGIAVPAGVTLAGGRGRGGARGGLLYTQEHVNSVMPLLLVKGENVRITGLRVRGADSEIGDHTYGGNYKLGRGIQTSYTGLEVDNCEISGWGHAGIYLPKGAAYAHIHHNYIHNNRRSGLGYGICQGYTTDAEPIYTLIEANIFDCNRHHIASTGTPGVSYEARYNISLSFDNGHCFDMHGGADRGDGTDIAGDWIKIYRNTFRDVNQSAVIIRGVPQYEAQIHNNWFYHNAVSSAVRQTNATGNMTVADNHLGITSPAGTTLPFPKITVSAFSGVSPLSLEFNGAGSRDSDGSIVSWHWKFGDGNTDLGNEAVGTSARHIFTEPGRYNVMLTVRDNTGIPMSTMIPVTVTPKDRAILSFWVKDSFREDNPNYFNQEALVDGEVVWQENIAGDQGWQHVYVDVTDRVAGKDSVKLTFRVTCLQDIRFPEPLNLYSYTEYVDLFSYWDDVVLFGFEVKNGDFESSGNWTYSEGNGTLPSGRIYAGDARSGFNSYMLTYPYLGEPNAGAWAQMEQTIVNQAPSIVAHGPDGSPALVDAEVSVTFSEPMNQPAAESAFTLSPSESGTFKWVQNRMIFVPEAYLRHDQHYTVSVSTTATDLAGKPLVEAFSWQFATIPEPPEQKVVVYPNPYIKGHGPEKIRFSNLTRQCTVNIFNTAGRFIAALEHQDTADGGSEAWDVSDVGSGVYLYWVKYPSGNKKGKVSIVK